MPENKYGFNNKKSLLFQIKNIEILVLFLFPNIYIGFQFEAFIRLLKALLFECVPKLYPIPAGQKWVT